MRSPRSRSAAAFVDEFQQQSAISALEDVHGNDGMAVGERVPSSV
jgi:hypothetical protein